MLPMRGYPFGPGGYDSLLFFCHFQTRAKDTTAQSDAASSASSILIMLRGRLGEVRGDEESSVPSAWPQLYTRSVSGDAEERYPTPGGVVNAEPFIVG